MQSPTPGYSARATPLAADLRSGVTDGDQLITLTKSDLATAIGRFATARPRRGEARRALGGEQAEESQPEASAARRRSYGLGLPTFEPGASPFVPQVEYRSRSGTSPSTVRSSSRREPAT